MERPRKKCVTGFIEDIWNNNQFDMLPKYLHKDFIDHSLPCGLQNSKGFRAYLMELQKNISHKTTIEKLTIHRGFVIAKVKIILSALPNPEDNEFCHKQDEVIKGYRIFTMSGGYITGHWEFLDHPTF
jgi:hypothetical protein